MSDESFTDKVARCKQLLPLPDLMAKVGHGTGKSDTDGNFLISSPFRQDRNPSFSVYRKDGEWKWKDHGTHEGGDELEYIVKMEGYDKSDALRWYQELCGIVEDGSKPIDPPAPPYNWSPCKEAMDEKKIEIVASARGLPIDFCKAMVQANYIGNYNYQTAFPVFNKSYTKLVAVHYKTSNGKWGYEPSGTKTTALIFGDIRHAKDVYWCESQWDAMAAAAALGWMPNDQSCRHIAFASSRGMSNGQLIGDLPVSKKARIILLTQNDEAGTAWEEKSIKAIREKLEMPVYKVFTVAPHKDINDWYKAGDFEIDIQRELENPKRIKKEGELPCPDDATSFLGERIVTPPELIKGVMHQGTKAVIGGPSKAYKTWDLMDLGVSVATGSDWWEFPCSKGNVLYLEL